MQGKNTMITMPAACIHVHIYNTSSSFTLLTCYLLRKHAHFSCCSPITPAFSVGRFVSAKLHCGMTNQDSTRHML